MLVVQTTLPSRKQAQDIAQKLVEEKLAACASFWKVNSVFFWQGKLQKESEWLLELKCPKRKFRQLSSRIKQLHPYKLPQIIALSLHSADKNYSSWVEGKA